MQAEAPQTAEWDSRMHGLDQSFLARLYVRAAQVGAVACLSLMGMEQRTAAAGTLSGLVVGLASLWTIEMMVRLLFSGGRHAGVKLAVGAAIKMPLFLAGLMGIAWASMKGHMNIFGVVGGVLLVHATALVMVLSTAARAQDTLHERYR